MRTFKLEIRRMSPASVTSGVCAALAIGAIVFAAPAEAQQPAPAQPQKPAQASPAKKPGKKQVTSAWVKLCEDVKNKKGDVCLVHHERFHPNTGRPLISAAIRNSKIKGQEQEKFLIMVPLGHLLQAGVLLKVDENKPFKLDYSFCTQVGCVAEATTTPELITILKTGSNLDIAAMALNRKRAAFRVPLSGFTRAYDGPPIDRAVYAKARKRMFQAIRKRQLSLKQKAEAAAKLKKDAQGAGAAPAPKKAP